MQKQIKLFLFLALIFSAISTAQTNAKHFVVVLDAGHGGKDPGRPTNFGYKEKDIALDVALRVGKNLEKHAGGVELKGVNFKNFESKHYKNLFFAGEVLNIDAVTGGFNFQNAWTSAFIAAQQLSK
jgi:hypothetical protein